MSVIGFITLLQDYPWLGFLLALIFFAFMFSIKNVVVYWYSRQLEKEQADADALDEQAEVKGKDGSD